MLGLKKNASFNVFSIFSCIVLFYIHVNLVSQHFLLVSLSMDSGSSECPTNLKRTSPVTKSSVSGEGKVKLINVAKPCL